MLRSRLTVLAVALLLAASPVRPADKAVQLSEGWSSIMVRSEAPIPSEVQNETQAKALSREAAITLGQTEILNYVLKKKARSGKPLSEAEIPSLDLQRRIRGYVQGTKVKKTEWVDGVCRVVLVLDKSELKRMMRKN